MVSLNGKHILIVIIIAIADVAKCKRIGSVWGLAKWQIGNVTDCWWDHWRRSIGSIYIVISIDNSVGVKIGSRISICSGNR